MKKAPFLTLFIGVTLVSFLHGTSRAETSDDTLGFTWWNDVPERIRRGNELYRQENFEEAERFYRDAQLDAPRDAISTYNLGLSHARQGRHDQAISSFLRSLSLAGENDRLRADAHYNMGVSQLQQAIDFESEGEREDAIEAAIDAIDSFNSTLRIDPDDADALTNRQQAQHFLQYFSIPPPEMEQQQQQDGQQGEEGEESEQSEGQQDQQQQQQDQDQQQDQQDQSDQQQQGDPDSSDDQDQQDQQDEQDGQEDAGEQQEQDRPQQTEPEELTEEQARRLLNMLGDPENIRLRKGSRLTQPEHEKPW